MTREQRALGCVQFEAFAGVRDVQVAHRELPDAVGGSEGRVLDALHGEFLRLVGQVRAAGVEDGVVVAATQPQVHLAGDGGGHPALD